jgi:hypothetical protein
MSNRRFFSGAILREDCNATGDAGDATLNPGIPAIDRDAVHANVRAAQFVDMRRGGHVACPLQNRCRKIACRGWRRKSSRECADESPNTLQQRES